MSISTKSRDNVYVDIIMTADPSFEQYYDGTPAQYIVNKTVPIIDKASDYYMSIIGFTIPLKLIPLYVVPIQIGQANINLTTLKIGIENNINTTFTQPLIYTPQNNYIPLPAPPLITQDISKYYYCYSYQNMIDMANVALNLAWIASGSVGPSSPYFYYNSDTNLINLIVSSAFISAGYKIYFNQPFELFFSAFNTKINIPFNPTVGNIFYMILNNTGIEFQGYKPKNVPPPAPGIIDYYFFEQEYVTIQNSFNSLRKIFITTNTLSIGAEIIPVFDNLSNTIQTNQTSYLPIVSTFTPQLANAGDSRSVCYYVPTGNYKLIDLLGDNPVSKFDLKIFWQERGGKYYPVEIAQGDQAEVKVAFFKKSLYNNSNKYF